MYSGNEKEVIAIPFARCLLIHLPKFTIIPIGGLMEILLQTNR